MREFADVDVWIFDLDNTLYPRHTRLFDQVDRRICDYVAHALAVSPAEARRLQKDYYRRYGTTLRGLMLEHDIEPDAFLEFVHDIDHSPVTPDPRLGRAIDQLPGRRFIFTNGSKSHAEKVSQRLGFTDQFERIFDILWAELVPKPHFDTYAKLIAETGIDPRRAAMFEDLARNLEVPHALGMRTVLIVPEDGRNGGHEAWEAEGRDAPYVEHVTDDLSGFVEALAAALERR